MIDAAPGPTVSVIDLTGQGQAGFYKQILSFFSYLLTTLSGVRAQESVFSVRTLIILMYSQNLFLQWDLCHKYDDNICLQEQKGVEVKVI